jgi:hypothetical protein
VKLTPKHAAELERLVGRFVAIQAEGAPAAVCRSCTKPWQPALLGDLDCCGAPELYYPPDTRFARQVELMPAGLAIIAEAHALARQEEREQFITTIAASLLPWQSAGDDAAAVLAVHTARQLLAAAERDGSPLHAPS